MWKCQPSSGPSRTFSIPRPSAADGDSGTSATSGISIRRSDPISPLVSRGCSSRIVASRPPPASAVATIVPTTTVPSEARNSPTARIEQAACAAIATIATWTWVSPLATSGDRSVSAVSGGEPPGQETVGRVIGPSSHDRPPVAEPRDHDQRGVEQRDGEREDRDDDPDHARLPDQVEVESDRREQEPDEQRSRVPE